MSESRSLGRDYHRCSQSRKVSIGVLVESLGDMKTESISEAGKLIAENLTSGEENLVEDRAKHTPLVEKSVIDLQKAASPWISTKTQKLSSSVPVHDAKITQNFPAARRTLSRPKQSMEASLDHPVELFASKRFGLESYKDRQNNSGKASCALEARKVSNVEPVENHPVLTEPGLLPQKDFADDKIRKTEPGGSETLRTKLWEIMGNVSSPKEQSPSVPPIKIDSKDLNTNLERDGKDSPVEKANPHSDTIESDSERPDHNFRRPLTHYLTRKMTSTRKQQKKINANNSTSHRKERQERSTVSVRGDSSRRPSDNVDTSFLHRYSQRNKIDGEIFEKLDERRQPYNKRKSFISLQRSTLQGSKAENGNSSNDRRKATLVERKSDIKIRNSSVSPNNVTTEQPRDVGQQRVFEIPNSKFEQEDLRDSSVKNKTDHAPPTFTFQTKSPIENSPGRSPLRIQTEEYTLSNAEKKSDTKSIHKSKILLNSKSTKIKSTGLVELSDGCGKVKAFSPLKPSFALEQDGEDTISRSSSAATDSENSEDDFHIKGCRKPMPLSPEIAITKHFPRRSGRRLCNQKGNEETSKLQVCMEQDNQDGFASAVALLTVALDRVQTKMKLMIDKRSAEILMETADGIFLHLQHAESQITKHVGKLINLSKSKRRRLDVRFQEQNEQLIDIHKRFKLEVDQHVKDYDSLIGDLEELGLELQGNVEIHRASNMKFLTQAEQAISTQLDEAERKILDAQELAREKMFQLKRAIAECVKHAAFRHFEN